MTRPPSRAAAATPFGAAVCQVLEGVQRRLGTAATVLTRIEDDEWVVLQAAGDDGIVLRPGDIFDAGATLCTRMLAGHGPALAPDTATVPAYATAPLLAELGIGAYVGAPVRLSDGTLFGTVCALDRRPRPELTAIHLAFLGAAADQLATRVEDERVRLAAARAAIAHRLGGERDALTGLAARAAWDAAIELEAGEAGLGDRYAVLILDIDGLRITNDRRGRDGGDAILRRVADALGRNAAPAAVVARLGGDEFGVLLHGRAAAGEAHRLHDEVRRLLRAGPAPVRITAGIATARGGQNLPDAVQLANARLYALKAARRNGSGD